MRQSISISDMMPIVRDSGLLSSLCTITRSPEAFDDGGAPIAATAYVAVSGMEDIPCIAAPLSDGVKLPLLETKTTEKIVADTELHVLLDDYYPDIRNDDRAVIDGTEYEISNVERDSQKQMTRLGVKLVTL